MNKELQAYIEFIKDEKLAKPVNSGDGIFLGETVSFATQEVVLFQKKSL